MQIHAIRTGTIRVKNRYVNGMGRLRLMRLTAVLLDDDWVDIPVYTWVIEHPEGLIVVDTGESANVNQEGYFPAIQRPYWRSQYRFNITPYGELSYQMRQRGLIPEQVRWIIMTHAHFDHTDGLAQFSRTHTLFSRKEYEIMHRWRAWHFAFPEKWDEFIKTVVIDYQPEPFGAFSESYAVTRAGDVRIVPTPGHTLGHQSVIVQEGDTAIFLGGDTSFNLDSLLDGTIDAPSFNSHLVLKTRQRILDTAAVMPLVYLTTHDFDTERRLNEREILNPELAEVKRVPVRM